MRGRLCWPRGLWAFPARPLLWSGGESVRRKIADPWYKSARWLQLRGAVLRRDKFLCQDSLRYGRRVAAEAVHHVFPRNEFPEFAFAPWNCVSLSNDAHDQMHDRRTGALTKKGVELLRRTARRRGMEVPLRYRDT